MGLRYHAAKCSRTANSLLSLLWAAVCIHHMCVSHGHVQHCSLPNPRLRKKGCFCRHSKLSNHKPIIYPLSKVDSRSRTNDRNAVKTCQNAVSLCAHLYTAAYFQHKYEEKSCQGQQNDHPSVLNTIRKPCNTNASRLGFCNLFVHSGTISEETKHNRAGETRRECPGLCTSPFRSAFLACKPDYNNNNNNNNSNNNNNK